MSYTQRVLQAMTFGHEHTAEDIAAITHIGAEEVGQCLHLLAKGGVIECTHSHRCRKNRKYTTKQRQLFVS